MFHKDLEAWKESIKLVKLVYKLTNDFPNQELYGLTSQIRRAFHLILQKVMQEQLLKKL